MLIVIYLNEKGSSSVDEQHQKNQTKPNPNPKSILLTLDYKTHLPSIFNTHSFMTFCFNDYTSNLQL